jgi:hypothetical protein
VNLEGPLSPRAYCAAAAVAFLIAGSGTASAVVEDMGQPAMAVPGDGVAQGPGLFRAGDGSGTSGRDFTSPGASGNIISSVGSDNGTEGQDGAGPLPTFDDLKADYSSSTVDPLFPAWVTNSGSADFDSWVNEQTLFGDNDYAGGLFVNVFGSRSLGLSSFASSDHRSGNGGSGGCSSDGSIAGVEGCERKEELSSLIAGSPGVGSDAGYQPAQQIPNFPGSNPFFGGAHPSVSQIPGFEMIQNSFAMTWPSGVIQGTFPPGCCDVTLPVVGAPTSDVSSNSGPETVQPVLSNSVGTGQGPVVPEIPQWAMLLIGFGGLALVGWRRLRGSGGAGSAFGTR